MPRSPSRDLVDRFSGNRGYFHRSDRLRRLRNVAALVALGLVLGWAVVELARPSAAATAHTHGTLAHVPAAWDANCEACHRPHSAGEFFKTPFSVFGTRDRWHDLTCEKCHSGPAHHSSVADTSFHDRCTN